MQKAVENKVNKIDYALEYAQAGYRVFPLAANGKEAAVKWKDEASSDPAVITSWWGISPQANIGVLASGFLVVDVDTKNGKRGDLALQEYMARHGYELPEGWRETMIRTPSGGWHLYLRDPSPTWTSQANALGIDGVDLKGAGKGYVVGAGSTIDGKRYEGSIIPISALPAVPDWLQKKETAKPSRVIHAPQTWKAEEVEIKWLLDHIDVDDLSYDDWVRVGFACKVFSEEALHLWDEWSSKGSLYEQGECEKKWEGFPPDSTVSVGTLYHFAKKTRADYRKWQEQRVISDEASMPFTPSLSPTGKPYMNLDNVIRAINADPSLSGRIWYDQFLNKILTTWEGEEREWQASDDVRLQLHMQRAAGLATVSLEACQNAALHIAFANKRNECKSWLESLVWDGAPRLASLMHLGFGAEDTEYTRAVGRCWLTSVAARVITPGCKVDTVPVLEGMQGAGKSTSLKILGGKWFTECHESVMTKDFYGVLQGHMLVEISEMHSFKKAEVTRIKGIISCQVDRFRPAYGRHTQSFPRQSVLVCTTNQTDWHKDETGGRRFWPVSCGVVNQDWIRLNRDQLFAEAVSRFRAGESWWDVPAAEQEQQVEARREVDSWEDTVNAKLNPARRYTTAEILSDFLGVEVSRQEQVLQRRVSRIMTALKWEQKVTKAPGDRTSRREWRYTGAISAPVAPVSTVSTGLREDF